VRDKPVAIYLSTEMDTNLVLPGHLRRGGAGKVGRLDAYLVGFPGTDSGYWAHV